MHGLQISSSPSANMGSYSLFPVAKPLLVSLLLFPVAIPLLASLAANLTMVPKEVPGVVLVLLVCEFIVVDPPRIVLFVITPVPVIDDGHVSLPEIIPRPFPSFEAVLKLEGNQFFCLPGFIFS